MRIQIGYDNAHMVLMSHSHPPPSTLLSANPDYPARLSSETIQAIAEGNADKVFAFLRLLKSRGRIALASERLTPKCKRVALE